MTTNAMRLPSHTGRIRSAAIASIAAKRRIIIDSDPGQDDAVATLLALASPIETASPLTLGMTVADWWAITDRAKNVHFLREVDADGFYALLTERLARLP